MGNHSTARVLTGEDGSAGRTDLRLVEDERRNQLVMIETMLRDGYDEDEITAALHDQPVREYQPAVAVLAEWLRTKLVNRQAPS